MPAKKSAELTEWKKKEEELKANMPKNKKGKPMDARTFKGCLKDDGTWNEELIADVCKKKGCTEKIDAVKAFLNLETKPTVVKSKGKKRVAKKQSSTRKGKIDLFSNKTYNDLKYTDIKKIRNMLSDILNDKKEKRKEELVAVKNNADKEIQELDAE